MVVALCALGLAMRLPGLTTRPLWFDDAWAALPAHVSLTEALRMVVTTPLYTLGMREWILLGPSVTWWAQLPALVLGVAGIAAMYLLVRAHRFSPLAAFVAAALVAAGPTTLTYSTRVKEYSADLLLSCLILWLVNRWRRNPSWHRIWALAAVSVAALWISASTAAVVGGAACVTVVVGWASPPVRRQMAALLGTLATGSLVLWLVFLRHIPTQLRTNWRTHGYLFGYSSSRHVAFEFQQTFSGIAHGLLGIPIPFTFSGFSLRADPMALSIATVLVLGLLVVPPVVAVAKVRGRYVGPMFASSATLVVAVVGTLSGVSPLGDGRTDEALYPAILLLLVGGFTALSSRGALPTISRPATRIGIALVVGAGAIWYGVNHTAAYPPTGVDTVVHELERSVLKPGDIVVVDPYLSFTYGDDDLGPWHVSFTQGVVPWPMGYHVVTTKPDWVISTEYLQPDDQLVKLLAPAIAHHRTVRVWYLGITVGAYSLSAPKYLWQLPFTTPTLSYLEDPPTALVRPGLGLAPQYTCCHADGTYAWLFELNPPHHRARALR